MQDGKGREPKYAKLMWALTPEVVRQLLPAAKVPIVASGQDYDFARADFEGTDVLAGIPHVFVSMINFETLWENLAAGIHGDKSLEWMSLPMYPGTRSPYGFLAIKPASRPYPIVFFATLIDQLERVFSFAGQHKSPTDVRLVEAKGDADDWLASMSPHYLIVREGWVSKP
jgi:hypothetical protein